MQKNNLFLKKSILILLLLLPLLLEAKIYSLKEIEKMPKSIARDYYIWRLLNETKVSKEDAKRAYELVYKKNYKIRKAIRKVLGYVPSKSKKKDPKNFIIYPEVAAKKSKKELKRLYKKILAKGKYSDVLKVMASDNPFEALKSVTPKTFCYIFNRCQTKYRKKYLNYPLSKEQLNTLPREEQFNQSIFKIVTTPKLDRLRYSLLDINTTYLPFKSVFLLGINAVTFNKIDRAIEFFKIAKTKIDKQSSIDKCNFWLYLLTKDKKYLQLLRQSSQINIYTLKARDILKLPYPTPKIPKLKFSLVKYLDPYSPIDWANIKIAIKEHPETIEVLADNYASSLTEGIYSYLKEKASDYKIEYFAMPYQDAMIGKSKERVALLYAIARQESRFVPASISPSYALGMMQIMPFLIKHLAKQRHEKIDLDDMFDPYISLKYANTHLDYLTKYLYHPLLIAYAYNGGIGFTKRSLRSSHLFKKGKYEPFLSMELIDYEESKEYAKKVLANYVIYYNLLGGNITISELLDKLHNPLLTDKFR